MDKYLQGDARYSAEDRIKVINAVIRMGSTFGGVLTIHAEGSLATQRMVVYQMADWAKFKAIASRGLGIKTDHPDYQQPLTSPWKMPDSLLKAVK